MFYSSLPYCFNGAVFAAVDRYVRLSARLVLNLNAIMIVIPSADKLQKHHLYGSPQPCQHSRNPLYNPCTLDLPWMSLMQVINTMLHINLSLTLNSVTKRNVVGTSQVQNGPVFLSFWGHLRDIKTSTNTATVYCTLCIFCSLFFTMKLLHMLMNFLFEQEVREKACQKTWLNQHHTVLPDESKHAQHQRRSKLAESSTWARFHLCENSHCSFATCSVSNLIGSSETIRLSGGKTERFNVRQ